MGDDGEHVRDSQTPVQCHTATVISGDSIAKLSVILSAFLAVLEKKAQIDHKWTDFVAPIKPNFSKPLFLNPKIVKEAPVNACLRYCAIVTYQQSLGPNKLSAP